jgi:hypothetical protein
VLHKFLTKFSAPFAEFRVGAANLAGFRFQDKIFAAMAETLLFEALTDHVVVKNGRALLSLCPENVIP